MADTTSTTYYELIYNDTTKTTECAKNIDAATTVKSVITDWKNSTDLYWEFYRAMLYLEAKNKGSAWKVYCDTKAFAWG